MLREILKIAFLFATWTDRFGLCATSTTAEPFNREVHCRMPPETGQCRAYMPSFYYDAKRHTCRDMVYGGCQGNRNRFPTANLCMTACNGIFDDSGDMDGGDVRNLPFDPVMSSLDKRCFKPPASGCSPTANIFKIKFYLNLGAGNCESDYYCNTDFSRVGFDTIQDCTSRCAPKVPSGTVPPVTPTVDSGTTKPWAPSAETALVNYIRQRFYCASPYQTGAMMRTLTPRECAVYCDRDQICSGFTYYVDTQICELELDCTNPKNLTSASLPVTAQSWKKIVQLSAPTTTTTQQPVVVTRSSDGPFTNPNYQALLVHCGNELISWVMVYRTEECMTACDQRQPTCTGFSYYPSIGRCVLRKECSALTVTTKNIGEDSYLRTATDPTTTTSTTSTTTTTTTTTTKPIVPETYPSRITARSGRVFYLLEYQCDLANLMKGMAAITSAAACAELCSYEQMACLAFTYTPGTQRCDLHASCTPKNSGSPNFGVSYIRIN